MSARHGRREAAVLEMLRPSFEDQGFEVFLHPPRHFLPEFMKGYQPDAIAIMPGRKIAIEVNANPTDTPRQPQVQNISALFQGQKDWEFRLVYAPAPSQPPEIAKEPKTIIEASLDRLPAIYDQSGPLPALLSAWSLFEAAARWLIPDELRQPQPPGELVDKLAFEGFVTVDEAAPLRPLARLHDEAAHGRLEIVFSRDDLLSMAEVIRTLLDQSAAPEASAPDGSA